MFNYYSVKDKKIATKFQKHGFIVFNLDKKVFKLNKIRNFVIRKICNYFKLKNIIIKKSQKKNILNIFHKYIQKSDLNELRLNIYNDLNDQKWFIQSYFGLAKRELEILCGNELVMQRKVNLSIQLPYDDSSLLPVHSDVWSGCSPYEIVLWIPLVNCWNTKSMFILPHKYNMKIYKNFKKFKNSNHLQKKIDKKIKWVKVNYGQGIIFSHQLIHGNKINYTEETRWSFNCRFKSLMSPYDEKDIAETFLPILIRPATRFGMNYKEPNA